jgi:hypothetical protein
MLICLIEGRKTAATSLSLSLFRGANVSSAPPPPLDPPLWCPFETKRGPILDTTGFFNFQDVYLDEVAQNTHSLLPLIKIICSKHFNTSAIRY